MTLLNGCMVNWFCPVKFGKNPVPAKKRWAAGQMSAQLNIRFLTLPN
jgi:hypothetical protein